MCWICSFTAWLAAGELEIGNEDDDFPLDSLFVEWNLLNMKFACKH